MSSNTLVVSKLTSRFEEALVYATRLHATQVRKGSDIPYIAHLLSVAALVLEDGGNEDEAIASLLHDAIEDQGGVKTRTEIYQLFGETVAKIVDGCTDSEVMPKPPWEERKQAHIDKMRSTSPEVRRVSQADKLHNIRSTIADWYQQGDAVWHKFKGGKTGTLWYYRSLLEVFQETEPSFLTQELERAVNMLEQLAQT